MLDEIVNEISVAGVTPQFLEVDAKVGVEWLEENCANAARLFKNFIKRHAHRSIEEVRNIILLKLEEFCPSPPKKHHSLN